MKYPLFCVRDVKVGFGQPMVHMSDQVAIRDFSYKINQPNSLMDAFPGDFDLYQVGVFDTDSGEIEKCLPVFIISGKDVYGDSYGEVHR